MKNYPVEVTTPSGEVYRTTLSRIRDKAENHYREGVRVNNQVRLDAIDRKLSQGTVPEDDGVIRVGDSGPEVLERIRVAREARRAAKFAEAEVSE